MFDEIKLLPLPEKVEVDKHLPTGIHIYAYDVDTLRTYARANVLHYTAGQAAEINALREQLDWAVKENDRLLSEGRELDARAERQAVELTEEMVKRLLDHLGELRCYYVEARDGVRGYQHREDQYTQLIEEVDADIAALAQQPQPESASA